MAAACQYPYHSILKLLQLVLSIAPQLPQTEQQNLKCGSTIPAYSVFKVSRGKNFLACSKRPISLLIFDDRALI